MTNLQEQISKRLREMMERRLANLLKANHAEFAGLTGELSLIDLLNGIFVLEGQSETIGAYAGAVRFIVDVVGNTEAWRRSIKPEPEVELIPEQVN